MTYDLASRLDRAARLRAEGYNCAQTVLMVFDDITGIGEDMSAKIAAGLGAGVAATQEICGVPNAMAIISGLVGQPGSKSKVKALQTARPLISEFSKQNDGRIRCKDLKTPPALRPCNDLIFQGIEIIHKSFENS